MVDLLRPFRNPTPPIPPRVFQRIDADCNTTLQIVFYGPNGSDIYNNGPDSNNDGIQIFKIKLKYLFWYFGYHQSVGLEIAWDGWVRWWKNVLRFVMNLAKAISAQLITFSSTPYKRISFQLQQIIFCWWRHQHTWFCPSTKNHQEKWLSWWKSKIEKTIFNVTSTCASQCMCFSH